MGDAPIDYRARIYRRYASLFQDAPATFDTGPADRWGRAYDYYMRGWLPRDKDAAIVDLACGSGRLLHFFKQRGYTNISGVDLSPEQVRLARQVVASVTQDNVLAFLDTRRDSFDLITGLDIVEHFRKDEVLQFLDGCLGALKCGGRLILQTPNAESPWGTHLRYDDFTHEIGLGPNPITRLLLLAGGTDVVCREVGPVPRGYSPLSTLRWVLWQGIRQTLKAYNLVETGTTGSGVFTRVFMVTCTKAPLP